VVQWYFGSNKKLSTWNKMHFQIMCKNPIELKWQLQ
jgi:hypothetical protein